MHVLSHPPYFIHGANTTCLSSQFKPTFSKWTEETIGPEYKLNAWALQIVGVSPEHQRKGITKKLIETVEKLVGSHIG